MKIIEIVANMSCCNIIIATKVVAILGIIVHFLFFLPLTVQFGTLTSQHVEGDSTKLAKDMKKIIMALLYIL